MGTHWQQSGNTQATYVHWKYTGCLPTRNPQSIQPPVPNLCPEGSCGESS